MLKNNSPWLHQLDERVAYPHLSGERTCDLCIIGGGISGVASAFFTLKYTEESVCLLEKDRIAHGATGHNAGYVVADFERSYDSIKDEYGEKLAEEGFKEVEAAWSLLSEIAKDIGVPEPVRIPSLGYYDNLEKFLDDVYTILDDATLNKAYLKKDSPWIELIQQKEKELSLPLFDCIQLVDEDELSQVTPLKPKLFTDSHGFISEECAVLNSALFTEKLVHHLLSTYGGRFSVYEHSQVSSINLVSHAGCIVNTEHGSVIAKETLLCTNGFENFSFYGPENQEINTQFHKNTHGVIGYMTGTLTERLFDTSGALFRYPQEVTVSDSPLLSDPYIYSTERAFVHREKGLMTLTSLGGPEIFLADRSEYIKDHETDAGVYKELVDFQHTYLDLEKTPDFHWHGLMGYTSSGIRIVGRDITFPHLLYNTGCNGIGILPSIAGARRIARLLCGENLSPSIFDPKF